MLDVVVSWGGVEAGGTIIGLGSGAELLLQPKAGFSRVQLRRQALKKYPPVVLGPDAKAVEAAGRFRAIGLRPKAAAKKKSDAKKKVAGSKKAVHPYDVAPVVGLGARAFLPKAGRFFQFPKTQQTLDTWLKPLLSKNDKSVVDGLRSWADGRLRRYRPQGAFLRVDLEPEHWLSFGSPTKLPIHFHRGSALVAELPVRVPVRFAGLKTLHVSGLLWPESAGRIALTAYVTSERLGRGQVILFAGNPVFRGVTWAAQRLFLNAVFFGPGMGTSWSRPTAPRPTE